MIAIMVGIRVEMAMMRSGECEWCGARIGI
jgi:hypothetical protein